MILLQGIVLATTGVPATAGIEVTVHERSKDELLRTTTTGPDGRWQAELLLASERLRIHVKACDSAAGGTSGRTPVTVSADEAPLWLVLRLRPTTIVSGRIVNEGGTPVSGAWVRVSTDRIRESVGAPWQRADARRDWGDAEADEQGRFTICLRAAPGGTVAAIGPDGFVGPERRFQVGRNGLTEVGDVLLPEEGACRWTLRFVDEAGETLRDAKLMFGAQEIRQMQLHPDLDRGEGFIAAEKGGIIQLTLLAREEPYVLGVGSPTHISRGIILDCQKPGHHSAVVRLQRRVVARLQLVGLGTSALRGVDLELSIRSLSRSWRHTMEASAIRVLTGESVSLPAVTYPRPAVILENLLRRGQVLSLTEGDQRILVAGPGEYRISCLARCGPVGQVRVELGGGQDEQIVELPVPAGRWVIVDCRELRRWAHTNEATTWLSPYATWPCQVPATVGPHGLEVAEGAIPLLGEVAIGQDEVGLWLAEDVGKLAFGFVESVFLGDFVTLRRTGVVPLDLDEQTLRIEAPVPRTEGLEAAVVKIVTHRSGGTFRQAGIPIDVHRVRSNSSDEPILNGSARAVTDSTGTAVLRLLPGHYACFIGREVVERPRSVSQWPRFEVPLGATAVTHTLELEFGHK